jgi:radical SAM protein with 4Fe4S-binding SPASM domain
VATVRVTPRATVQPCVYWPGGGAPLDILLDLGADVVATKSFVEARSVPEKCGGCIHLAACGGGCAGRRRLLGALGEPDPYCPIARGERRVLAIRQAPAREMPKLESACTTIVMARD